MKKSKNKKKISKEPTQTTARKSKTILKRKQARKDKRQAAKTARKEYVSKKFRKTKLKDHEDEEIPSDGEEVTGRSVDVKQKVNRVDQNEHEKMKKQMKELKRQQKKQRKRQLLLANEAEEQNIKQLEKNLGLKRRKSKNMPKSFMEDGLDFLLDACDSAKLANLNDEEMDDDFMDQDNGGAMDEQEDKESIESDGDSILDDIFSDNDDEKEPEEEPDQREDDVMSDSDGDEEEQSESEEEELDNDDLREDIYGRKRDARGNIVKDPGNVEESKTIGKYVPPALRNKQNLGVSEEKKKALERLSKQLKGLLNRLAESNMVGISRDIEKFYNNNSRNDVNRTLADLLLDCLVHETALIPPRLIMEHCMLVAILTANVGTEVGAFILQQVVVRFSEQFEKFNTQTEEREERDVVVDNLLVIISYLYSWHIVQCSLMFDVLNLLVDRFQSKDIQLIITALTNCGMVLRKDDPTALKNFILKVQSASSKTSTEDSRVLFMIEVLNGIKNNNVNKIPNYDPSHFDHLKKNLKSCLREGKFVTELNISYKDLIQAESKGRWWIVGSAFTGHLQGADTEEEGGKSDPGQEEVSAKLLDLARKMRMNTDTRRNIFCLLMSSEDYLDCVEKLVKLGTRNQMEREVVFVVTDCCIQETSFNPYYGHVASKLGSLDRKYRLAMTFCIWDRIKQLKTMKNFQMQNLAKLSQFLILEKAQSISLLKVIEFADMDKHNMKFLVTVLTGILETDTDRIKDIFKAVAEDPKLKIFRDSIQLFMNHFLLKQTKNTTDLAVIKDRIRIAEKSLSSSVSSLRL